MNRNGDLYHSLRQTWKDAYIFMSFDKREAAFQTFWKGNKANREALISKSNQLKLKIRARPNAIIQSFAKQAASTSSTAVTYNKENAKVPADQLIDSVEIENPANVSNSVDKLIDSVDPLIHSVETENQSAIANSGNDDGTEAALLGVTPLRSGPVQEKVQETISTLSEKIVNMSAAKQAGLLSSDQVNQLKQISKNLSTQKRKLKRLQTCQKANRKQRIKKKRQISNFKQAHPDSDIGPGNVGRPSLERDQPGLQDAIVNLIQASCEAHERRQSESLRCIKKVDDLLMELRLLGYNVSRSGLYLRFLPRDSRTIEGKRHVTTVNVKLIRAQNNLRTRHDDCEFAAATVNYLRDLAGLFGDKSVFVLSQDDKARIAMGLPAASKQGPILMTMDYPIRLPDHDWVIASRHKLIPSVYAALEIKNSKVSYSGPTYIAIRSGKHDSSTAYTHAVDLARLLTLESFQVFCKNENNIKPIWIFFVDGASDENPRYPKTLRYAVQHFKTNNLDAIFIATNAPHHSAYNPVERRMAPLSKDLCGLILPHDAFGSHLNDAKETIDAELELKNFQKAGSVLSEIWCKRVIDNFAVDAEYIQPDAKGTDTVVEESPELTEEWKMKHVHQSQYLLQVVKCNDTECCSRMATALKGFLQGQFLPAPVRFVTNSGGVSVGNLQEGSFLDLSSRLAFKFLVPANIPFDQYCPTVQSKIKDQICKDCQSYFTSKKALNSHRRIHRKGNQVSNEEADEHDLATGVLNIPDIPEIATIENLLEWLKTPFEEV